MKVDIWNQ